jgi:hypothetical protein
MSQSREIPSTAIQSLDFLAVGMILDDSFRWRRQMSRRAWRRTVGNVDEILEVPLLAGRI